MITEAILKINPNAKVVVRGDDINTCEIEWHNETAEISKADIEAMIPTVEAEEAVIANRKSEYGSNAQQIENIIENGLTAEQTRVQAIKDKYPKT